MIIIAIVMVRATSALANSVSKSCSAENATDRLPAGARAQIYTIFSTIPEMENKRVKAIAHKTETPMIIIAEIVSFKILIFLAKKLKLRKMPTHMSSNGLVNALSCEVKALVICGIWVFVREKINPDTSAHSMGVLRK